MSTLWLLAQESIEINLKNNDANRMELCLNGRLRGIISQVGGNERIKIIRKNSSYLKTSYIENCRVVWDFRQIVLVEEEEYTNDSVLVCSYDKIVPDWGKSYCYIGGVGDLNCCLLAPDDDGLVSFSLGGNPVIFNTKTAQLK